MSCTFWNMRRRLRAQTKKSTAAAKKNLEIVSVLETTEKETVKNAHKRTGGKAKS